MPEVWDGLSEREPRSSLSKRVVEMLQNAVERRRYQQLVVSWRQLARLTEDDQGVIKDPSDRWQATWLYQSGDTLAVRKRSTDVAALGGHLIETTDFLHADISLSEPSYSNPTVFGRVRTTSDANSGELIRRGYTVEVTYPRALNRQVLKETSSQLSRAANRSILFDGVYSDRLLQTAFEADEAVVAPAHLARMNPTEGADSTLYRFIETGPQPG